MHAACTCQREVAPNHENITSDKTCIFILHLILDYTLSVINVISNQLVVFLRGEEFPLEDLLRCTQYRHN